MTNQKLPKVDNIKENGVDMVTVSIGKETLTLTIDQAYGFAQIMETAASLPAALNHIDNVFEGWGDEGWSDGGTC